jgi:hypothetical protein
LVGWRDHQFLYDIADVYGNVVAHGLRGCHLGGTVEELEAKRLEELEVKRVKETEIIRMMAKQSGTSSGWRNWF